MSVTRAVLRWTVPIDGEWHPLNFEGDIVHVAYRRRGELDVWTLAPKLEAMPFLTGSAGPTPSSEYRVFATGEPVQGFAVHVGTAVDGADLVWHLFRQKR